MNHKFQYKICNGQMVDMDWERFRQLKSSQPDGEYEILVRKQVNWDTDQMRKYFHGPALGFIVDQFRRLGSSVSKSQAKEYLKCEFGPALDIAHGAIPSLPQSMSEYDFDTYKQFLTNVNAWCVECFECELPPAEQVE